MTVISPKIEPRHLRLAVVVYVRQSTPQQLQSNQESTRRQYGLAERARQMGWSETAVRVINDDLGMSGASSEGRAGFQRLVAAIGMGQVGIVLVTEVSRLSRLNSDWHCAIELLAINTVFERFAALGNARAVLRHFVDNGLLMPRMVQAGPDMGRIVWERPIYRMFHRMLVNPAYAGTFVYGRVRREITVGDPPVATTRRLPLEGVWQFYVAVFADLRSMTRDMAM
jgi:hypothetical protein